MSLRRRPGVKDALVTVAVNPVTQGRQLVAYLVAPTGALDPEEVRRSAAAELPEHMVPAQCVVIDALPLSPNGKVDLRALPPPGPSGERAGARTPPGTPTEARMARIWGEVLGLPGLGVHDHFATLGGDSLQAMRVVSRIRAAFQVDLPLSRFYGAPTIAELARFVDATDWARGRTPQRPDREEGLL